MSNAKSTIWKSGAELAIGDVIEIGWERFDRITSLRPYRGTLEALWDGQARIAGFATRKLEETIDPKMRYKVVI